MLDKPSQLFENDKQEIFSIVCGDANTELDQIRNESIQLIVTSPPYNMGKEYELDRKMSLEEYLLWLEPIAEKLVKKISKDGSLCWQVGNYINNGELFPLDFYFYNIFSKLGLKLRNRIIWRFNFGLHATNRLSGRYETMLWFTKTEKYKFNLDPIRVPQLYPGKTHSKAKANKAGKPSGNPLGKNPSDYWEFSAKRAFLEDTVWELPNVKASHPEKTSHPCQFPSELVERCVLAFTDVGDKVLDPFVGAGTTVIASLKHDRFGVGIDKDEAYVQLSKERCQALLEGALKLRPAGKPIRKPKRGEKVSTIPTEWFTNSDIFKDADNG